MLGELLDAASPSVRGSFVSFLRGYRAGHKIVAARKRGDTPHLFWSLELMVDPVWERAQALLPQSRVSCFFLWQTCHAVIGFYSQSTRWTVHRRISSGMWLPSGKDLFEYAEEVPSGKKLCRIFFEESIPALLQLRDTADTFLDNERSRLQGRDPSAR